MTPELTLKLGALKKILDARLTATYPEEQTLELKEFLREFKTDIVDYTTKDLITLLIEVL